MRRPLLALPLLAVFGAPASADDGLRPGETVRVSSDVFPGAVPETEDGLPTLWPVRIIDAWTGRPIPGATVRVPNHNVGGSAPEDIFDRCSGTADRDGWVRLPWKEARRFHDYIVADAPGYAPNPLCKFEAPSCQLVPGTDVPVQILDFTGQPVADARVALNLGCGHIPEQRHAVTDAQGRAVLGSMDPTVAWRNPSCIWLECSRLDQGPAILSAVWRPGDAPVPVYCDPGIVVFGRVLGPDGKPVENAVVGADDRERPWMRTGADGRFRLVGVEPWTRIDVYPTYSREEPMTWFYAPPEGVERTFVLGSAESGAELEVTLLGAAGEPAVGARVVAVRSSDGFTVPRMSDSTGWAGFSLPPGHYEVEVHGALGAWGAARGAVDLEEGGTASLTLTVPRRTTVRVDAARVKDLRVRLCTAREYKELKPAAIDGQDVAVPTDEPAAFLVWGHERGELVANIIHVPRQPPDDDAPLVLDWVPTTRVTARLVGPDGSSALGHLSVVRFRNRSGWRSLGEDTDATSTPSEETRLSGTLDWTAKPDDPGLAPAFGTLRIDERGKPVDLGEVQFRAAHGSALQLELPPGSSAEGAMATVTLPLEKFKWQGVIRSDNSLGIDLSWLVPGDVLTVSVPGPLVPRDFRVDAAGSWIVRWPDTSLRIHAVDEAGAPIPDASVRLDDPVVTSETTGAGALLLGIPPGTHEVLVAADGYLAKILTLTLAEGDPREVRVQLPVRD